MKQAIIVLLILLAICLITAFASFVVCGTEIIAEAIKLIIQLL